MSTLCLLYYLNLEDGKEKLGKGCTEEWMEAASKEGCPMSFTTQSQPSLWLEVQAKVHTEWKAPTARGSSSLEVLC